MKYKHFVTVFTWVFLFLLSLHRSTHKRTLYSWHFQNSFNAFQGIIIIVVVVIVIIMDQCLSHMADVSRQEWREKAC